MGPARRLRVLIAGEFASDLEDRIFREGRMAGLLCARVSGHSAWGEMLKRCRFDAVFLGLPGNVKPELVDCPPDVRIFVVGGRPREGGLPAQWFDPDGFEKRLRSIIDDVAAALDPETAHTTQEADA